MDPVEKMLVEKYGVDPEYARVMAYDIQHGAYTKGENAAVYKDAKTEAYTDVADAEVQRLDKMAKNARALASIHSRMAKGESLTPEEQNWYDQVKKMAGDRYLEAASRASTNRVMKFVNNGVKAQMAAERVPAHIDRINNDVATQQAVEQTSRDAIVDQLIPQPRGFLGAAGQTQGNIPMDPNIMALIAQTGRLR